MKRISAILLSAMFLFTLLSACGGNNTETPDATPEPVSPGDITISVEGGEDEGPPVFVPPEYSLPEKEADVYRTTADGKRHIRIGTWFDMYYDSTHEDIFANPSTTLNVETAQMELDRVRYVEEKYNVYIEFVNLTWTGIIESIPVSIMSGIPDCDIYLIDPQFGIPAVLNNMASPLEDMDINPEFKDDLFGTNTVVQNVKIPGQDKTYLFRAASVEQGMYMLGFNRNLLQEAGLEDPQELWYKGEWTWDVFREHCRVLTKADQDIYGYGGVWTTFLQQLLYSNDTVIAGGPQQTLTDPKTMEVLTFINDLYNTDKVARPWRTDAIGEFWAVNNDPYREGKSGYWITAPWIMSDFLGAVGDNPLPFDHGVVPFPVGPSGNQDTMATVSALGGNWYFIPRYIKDPGELFNVMYDMFNWYDYDLEYRDDLDWLYNCLITEENIEIYMDSVGIYGFDLWDKLGAGFYFTDMLGNDTLEQPLYTPASFAETFKQVIQDALDNYFG